MKRLSFLLAAVWVTGCALTTDNIDLLYTPKQAPVAVAGASDVEVTVTVTDLRQDKSNKVSVKKNGYGMEMAPVLSNQNVVDVVRSALTKELEGRGFKIGADASVLLNADLVRYWNDFKPGFWSGSAVSELNLGVAVKKKSGEIMYSKVLNVSSTEKGIQLMSGENAKIALERVLADGMEQLFQDSSFTETMIKAAK